MTVQLRQKLRMGMLSFLQEICVLVRAALQLQLDASKNRWRLGLIADSMSPGVRGISDGGATGIFRWR